MSHQLDLLVIAPHPDDAELGAGGTIAKAIDDGLKVGILDLTNGEPTPFGSPEIRAQETSLATHALGTLWRSNLGLLNRQLEPTLAARAALATVFRQTRPKWLFAPYWVDAHPDHVAATQLIEAARFWSKLTKTEMPGEPYHPERIFYYYCIHLKTHPSPAFVVDISDYWQKKRDAIAAYQSQFVVGREPASPTFLEKMEAQANYWGQMIGVRYGEPFASREPIGIVDFKGLR
jgi:bacillithiol biosynthesis deacetylase BshB1